MNNQKRRRPFWNLPPGSRCSGLEDGQYKKQFSMTVPFSFQPIFEDREGWPGTYDYLVAGKCCMHVAKSWG